MRVIFVAIVIVLIAGCAPAPAYKMPSEVISAINIADMEVGDSGYCHVESLIINRNKVGCLDLDLPLFTLQPPSLPRYLEVFRDDNGFCVILHGQFAWMMLDGRLPNHYMCVVEFIQTDRMEPILAVDRTQKKVIFASLRGFSHEKISDNNVATKSEKDERKR